MGTSAFAKSGQAPSPPIPVWRWGRGLLVHHGPQRAVGIDELLARAGQSGYDTPSYLLVDELSLGLAPMLVDEILAPNFPITRFITWGDVWLASATVFVIGVALAAIASFLTLMKYLRV